MRRRVIVASTWSVAPFTSRAGIGPAFSVGMTSSALALSPDDPLVRETRRVTAAALRQWPDRPRRLGAAVRLVLSAVAGAGLPPIRAIGWLRAYAGMRRAISAEQISNACFLAEQELFAHEERWLRLREATGPSLAGHLEEQVRALGVGASEEIAATVVREVHEGLGLTAVDEVYVTWLASLVLARTRPHVVFAHDGIDALDRVYHEQSKFTAALFSKAQEPGAIVTPPPPVRELPSVVLPPPAPEADDARALARVLRERRSARTGYDAELVLEQLGSLLGMAVGRAAPLEIEHEGRKVEVGRLTYPSAGARYPIKTYVLARRVTGLAAGLYTYDEHSHGLRRVGDPPARTALFRAAPALDGDAGDPFSIRAAEAPAILFLVADLGHQRERYGLRAYRLVHLETGHVAQNLCLAATALGLSVITIASFYDDLVNQLLGLDGVNRTALYAIPVGGG